MPPYYVKDPKEIYERIISSRNNFSSKNNCFGNTLYLIGLAVKEMFVPPDYPKTVNLLEECAEEESTIISLETFRGCQRKILHTFLIDPLDREVVYCRCGIRGGFMEAKRDFALMHYSEAAKEAGIEMDVKYCKESPQGISELLKDIERLRI